MIFRLNSEVFEYRIRPESFHVVLLQLVTGPVYFDGTCSPNSRSVRGGLDNVLHTLYTQYVSRKLLSLRT
jgi:hypothetical protein